MPAVDLDMPPSCAKLSGNRQAAARIYHWTEFDQTERTANHVVRRQ